MNPSGAKTRFECTEETIGGHHARIGDFPAQEAAEGIVNQDYCDTAAR